MNQESRWKRGEVQLEIISAGDGLNYPEKGQVVTIHYIGYLPSGKKFDSSRDREKPFKFKIGAEQVILGLDEGVAQLSIGEKAKVDIPAGLAYGTKGFPGLIPPNTNLQFEIELISINEE